MAKDVATFQSNKSGYPIPFGQAHHHSVGLSTYDMYIYVYTYVYVYIYIYIIVCVVCMYMHMHIHLHDHATILPLFSHYYPIPSITQVEAKLYNWGDYNRYSVQAVGKHTTWRAGSGGCSASCVLARRWKGANWTQKKKQTLNGGCDTRKNSDAGKLQRRKKGQGSAHTLKEQAVVVAITPFHPWSQCRKVKSHFSEHCCPVNGLIPMAIVIPIIKIDYFVQS